MKKIDFINDADTKKFTKWLSRIILEENELGFKHASDGIYKYLSDAKNNYRWPARATAISTPEEEILIERNSSLLANDEILMRLAGGLRKSLSNSTDGELKDWVRAIFIWGGVYTLAGNGQGNAGWLKNYQRNSDVRDYLLSAIKIIDNLEDESDLAKIHNLRSNAGLTKIYALSCQNFIIYDSRVAAALTWLVLKWKKQNLDIKTIPDHLRFATMRANTAIGNIKVRSADPELFPYFTPSGPHRNHVKHLTWNIRANWLIGQALDQVREKEKIRDANNIRNFEASLFVIGENLKFSL